jgi:hypothetical protein
LLIPTPDVRAFELICYFIRTKKDSFLGHKILDLPGKHSEDIWVSITQEEQLIYE